MATKKLESLTFIGRPFPPNMMSDNKSFQGVNAKMEQDEVFKKFLSDNHLEDKRTTMIQFGPDNYMYWYGVLAKVDTPVPKGLMKFTLPKAQVVQEESTAMINTFDLPINFLVQDFFKKVIKEGIKVYQNPGDSDTPYLVQDLNLKTKKLTQTWYLKVSD